MSTNEGRSDIGIRTDVAQCRLHGGHQFLWPGILAGSVLAVKVQVIMM